MMGDRTTERPSAAQHFTAVLAKLQALVTAPSGVANWNGPYWKKNAVPKDPWGNEYKYSSPAANAPYEIISYGADGKEGGDGANKDISSSQQ